MADDVGSIRDFQVTNLLGKGSMGDVWHAYRNNTNEAFAIKAIRKISGATAAFFRRVVEEREILSMVVSPFVVQMYWTFQDQSHVYFVLEHAKGGDLRSVMHNFYSDGMSEDHARFYIAEILLGLGHLHEMDIVVRDLKPSNCLTTEAGHILLADFGHSKRLVGNNPQGGNESDDVGPGGDDDECVGTPEYMAPETLQLEVEAGKMADYWSVGIILYELIHAHLPWGSSHDRSRRALFLHYDAAGDFPLR
jgi:serine/threonine protein kinase